MISLVNILDPSVADPEFYTTRDFRSAKILKLASFKCIDELLCLSVVVSFPKSSRSICIVSKAVSLYLHFFFLLWNDILGMINGNNASYS